MANKTPAGAPAEPPKLSKGLKIALIAVLVGGALYAIFVLRPMLSGPAETAAPTTTKSDDRAESDSGSTSKSKATTTTKATSGSAATSGSSKQKSGKPAEQPVIPNRGLNLPPELEAVPERNPMQPR